MQKSLLNLTYAQMFVFIYLFYSLRTISCRFTQLRTMLPPYKHFLRHLYYQMYRKNRETDQVNARARACCQNIS